MLLARAQKPEIANHFLKQIEGKITAAERAEVEEMVKAFNP